MMASGNIAAENMGAYGRKIADMATKNNISEEYAKAIFEYWSGYLYGGYNEDSYGEMMRLARKNHHNYNQTREIYDYNR